MEPNFDKPHREAFAEAEEKLEQVQTEKDTLLAGAHEEAIVEDKDFEYAEQEQGHMDGKEIHGKLSLEEIITLLEDKDYLSSRSEGEERIFPLAIRPLSKKEAFALFQDARMQTHSVVWDELEVNMPYVIPSAGNLDVLTIKFNRDISGSDAQKEMGALGVRPITYEELIQYGVEYPQHLGDKALVALGSKHPLYMGHDSPISVPILAYSSSFDNELDAVRFEKTFPRDKFLFLVVQK